MHLPAQLQVVFVNPELPQTGSSFPWHPSFPPEHAFWCSPVPAATGHSFIFPSLVTLLALIPCRYAAICFYRSYMVPGTKSILLRLVNPQIFFGSLSQTCWDLSQFCGHHPGVAGAPLFRVPKEHLTAQLGLLQHCWPEGFGLCFLLISLFC